jgi:ABC-2 type transport system permease protein
VSRPASLAAATRAQTAVELRLTARRGENVLAIVIIPVVVLILFSTTSLLAVPGGRAVDFLVPGSLTLAIVATGLVNLGIATAYERLYGVLKRLGGSPLTVRGLVTAKIVTVAVIVAVQVVLLTAVAVAGLDWRPAPGWSPATVLVAIVLGTAMFAGLGLLLAGTLRAEATLALANGLFIAAMLLGGIVIPTDHLPGPLPVLADLLPAAALSAALRIGLGAAGEVGPPLAILGAWALATIVLTMRTFRWE